MFMLNVAVWIVTIVIGGLLIISGWFIDLPNEIAWTARAAIIFYALGVLLGNWQVMTYTILHH